MNNKLNERIKLKMDMESGRLFMDEEARRVAVAKEQRRVTLLGVGMVVVFVLSVLLAVNTFNPNFSAAWLGQIFMRRINDVVDLLTGNHLQSGIHLFITQFACALVAGCALAISGACFQAIFHNPMASPTILGVESGGALGATVYVLFFYTPGLSAILHGSYEDYAFEVHSASIWQRFGQYFSVFLGCLAIVVIVMLITKISGRGRIKTVPLMVGGMIFTASISSFISLASYYAAITSGNPALVEIIRNLESGTFNPISTPQLLMYFAVPVIFASVIMLIMSNRLNVIAFGEEEAKTMGVNLRVDRVIFLLLSTILTAAVVAFCGTISFVGLIIPHFARFIVGNNFRHLIPASMFLGAIFMLLAFDLSYMTNNILNAGSIVNLAGGIIFAVFMVRYRRRGKADWA